MGGNSRRANRFLSVLVALTAFATVVPFAAQAWWIAELFSHFRIQLLVAGAVLLLASLRVRRFEFVAVLSVSLVINAAPVLPYVVITPELQHGNPVSVLAANVRAKNRDASKLLALVAANEPDLLLVLEFTAEFGRQLAVLDDSYPHQLLSPAETAFGIALYSRLPLTRAAVLVTGASDAVRATVTSDRGTFELIGVHLMPPNTRVWAADRNAQLERLSMSVKGQAEIVVVCGDFNLTPYSPYFGRFLSASGLRDARAGLSLGRTWPAGFFPLAIPIDHCLISDGIAVSGFRTLGEIGSDHYPVLIEFFPGRKL
jgi:endonuclease/exonuclease/phosphatase (EEP) superfamily protein YafD